MDADLQRFLWFALQALGGGFCTLTWFNYRDLKANLEANRADLAKYKIHIAETYVTQNELTKAIDAFHRSVDAIFAKLERIEDKLDHKQDKP